MRLAILLSMLFTAPSLFAASTSPPWPKISDTKASFMVTSKSPHIKMFLLSEKGYSLYMLECHKEDFEHEIDFPRTGSYEGFFQCKIVPEYDDSIDLFLPGDGWSGRRTRASFNTGWGDACENHEYYGLIREFSFRGMKITLSMSPIEYRPSILEMRQSNLYGPEYYSFKFDIEAIPDPLVLNEFALGVPEACSAGFHLDSNGKIVETVLKYPESE